MIEVSGYWQRMYQGLIDQGQDVTLLCLDRHPYSYGGPSQPWMVRAIQRVRSGHRTIFDKAAEGLLRCGLLVRFALTHDTFVFGYRTSFFNTRDLWLLDKLGKTVVVVFHGSDERPPFMDGYLGPIQDSELAPMTSRQKDRLNRCRRHADLIVSNPNSGQLQDGRSLTYHVLGNPVSSPIRATEPRPGTAADRTITVLHAPSNPEAKGSALIREVCEHLQDDGLDIELVEVVDLPNADLHRRILESDIVVDQAYGDCPWAMLAAEASLLGRPVIIGGYGHEHLRQFLPTGYVPPAYYCDPAALGSAITTLAMDEELRLGLASDARAFAMSRWSPGQVAMRLMLAIDGEAPDEWFFDADQIEYLWGGGITREEVRRRVGSLVHGVGPDALCLDDKPALLARLIEEAT